MMFSSGKTFWTRPSLECFTLTPPPPQPPNHIVMPRCYSDTPAPNSRQSNSWEAHEDSEGGAMDMQYHVDSKRINSLDYMFQ